MIRVGALAPYPASGPSTRFRLAQFRSPLATRGIELTILPFVEEDEYRLLYSGTAAEKVRLLVAGIARRRRTLSAAGAFDAMVIHRELAPLLNPTLTALLRRTGVPYIFDFDDAIYLPPRGGHPALRHLRRPLASTTYLARHAHSVLAGNAELASFARRARSDGPVANSPAPAADDGRAERVQLLPTVIDTSRFVPGGPRTETARPPVVGWIGTHTTAGYLEKVVPSLEKLRERLHFTFRVVSNQPPRLRVEGNLAIDFVPWSAEHEVRQTQDLAIGLYPLEDTAWERGKCGFKAIQYLSCGVPVVASPVGVMGDIVRDGVTGFAVDGGDWGTPIERLLLDPALAMRMGTDGREHVVASYSVDAVVDRWADAIRAAAAERPAR